VVGNKVQGRDDLDFLRADGHSDWVRALEKGRPPRFALLEDVNRRTLHRLRTAVDATYELRDAERYTRQMAHFHLKNAAAWGNERTGADLAAQIDPSFVLGGSAVAATTS